MPTAGDAEEIEELEDKPLPLEPIEEDQGDAEGSGAAERETGAEERDARGREEAEMGTEASGASSPSPSGSPSARSGRARRAAPPPRPVPTLEGRWALMATGIHEEAAEEDIREAFGDFGALGAIHMNLDRRTGFVKGYALVEYKDREAAEEAREKLAGKPGGDGPAASLDRNRALIDPFEMFFVPTPFDWRFGGSEVHLCGSFTRWVETIPMAPLDGEPGHFQVVVQLPPGYHQYKFIVDGEWRHDETQPFMPDPLGNVNNWLFVRKPDTAARQPPQQVLAPERGGDAAARARAGTGPGAPGAATATGAAVLPPGAPAPAAQVLPGTASYRTPAAVGVRRPRSAEAGSSGDDAGRLGAGSTAAMDTADEDPSAAAGSRPRGAAPGASVAAPAQAGDAATRLFGAPPTSTPGSHVPTASTLDAGPHSHQIHISPSSAVGVAVGGAGAWPGPAQPSPLGVGGGGPRQPQAGQEQAQQQGAQPPPGSPGQPPRPGGGGARRPGDPAAPRPRPRPRHEPARTRSVVRDFLKTHTAYELIPESGKVVVLDADLPMRQALHALHEQGIASAPLWDSRAGALAGVVSSSDFISMLDALRARSAEALQLMTEAEMDEHTIRSLRDEMTRGEAGWWGPEGGDGAQEGAKGSLGGGRSEAETQAGAAPASVPGGGDDDGGRAPGEADAARPRGGRPSKPKSLVSLLPRHTLLHVVKTLTGSGCHMAPILAERGGAGSCAADEAPRARDQDARPAVGSGSDVDVDGDGDGDGDGQSQGTPGGAPASPRSDPAGAYGASGIGEPNAPDLPEIAARQSAWDVLHNATLSGVLACLVRHLRPLAHSLPLLAEPIGQVPLGTWKPDAQVVLREGAQAEAARQREQEGGGGGDGGGQREGDAGDAGPAAAPTAPASVPGRDTRKVQPLATVQPTTPLTDTLRLLLTRHVSSVPVVDSQDCLLDVYARADITLLARGNAYSRLQAEDVTVGQALMLAAASPRPGGAAPGAAHGPHRARPGQAPARTRVWACSPADSVFAVIEQLAVPGVRRLTIVDPETRKIQGVVSLSDVATFLLL